VHATSAEDSGSDSDNDTDDQADPLPSAYFAHVLQTPVTAHDLLLLAQPALCTTTANRISSAPRVDKTAKTARGGGGGDSRDGAALEPPRDRGAAASGPGGCTSTPTTPILIARSSIAIHGVNVNGNKGSALHLGQYASSPAVELASLPSPPPQQDVPLPGAPMS
jgi:hypothetical protein